MSAFPDLVTRVNSHRNGSSHRPAAPYRCPYLGFADDSATAYAFADPANYCHRVSPPASVRAQYQGQFCLGDEHFHCPLYRQQETVPLPRRSRVGALEEIVPRVSRVDRLLLMGGLASLLVFLALFLNHNEMGDRVAVVPPAATSTQQTLSLSPTSPAFMVVEATPTWPATATTSVIRLAVVVVPATATRILAQPAGTLTAIPSASPTRVTATAKATSTVTAMATLVATATATASPSPTARATATRPSSLPTPTQTRASCGPPAGWVFYVVQPGENLFRISLRAGVGVTELQQANCMSGLSVYAGQRLYVPVPLPPPPAPELTQTPLPPPTSPPPTVPPPTEPPPTEPPPTLLPTEPPSAPKPTMTPVAYP